jgi:hypothetical protein
MILFDQVVQILSSGVASSISSVSKRALLRGRRHAFLSSTGFAQHVKNVPGRKTDVSECQWLQYLHSVGLLCAGALRYGFFSRVIELRS